MLQRIGATWPVRPLLLCAGAAYVSSFWTHPCFFLLCAGAVNTQLMLDYVTTHDNDITRRLSFLVRRRSEYAHFVFLDSRRHPWLLQSCPHGPYWGPLGVLTASLDDPSRSSVPSRSHRVLYVITLGALTASLDDPSRSSDSCPGHRVL